MYRISELANRAGLSRSTLLYYEKLTLLQGKRLSNGYRVYSDEDLERLQLVQQLQAAGLSLQECLDFFNKGLSQQTLRERHQALIADITEKQKAASLLDALLGNNSEQLKQFHLALDRVAPNEHYNWLVREGFDDRDITHLRLLSRNFHEHEVFMEEFLKIFAPLEQHGPGTHADSLAVIESIPTLSGKVLDIGCGPGSASIRLAEHSQAHILALDNLEQSLEKLKQRTRALGLEQRITAINGSMFEIPVDKGSLEAIWCENSAYVIGFERALKEWQSLLQAKGYLIISDLVWLKDDVAPEIREFWATEYPDMQKLKARITQCEAAGYELCSTHTLEHNAWAAYYEPLEARCDELADELKGSDAIAQLRREIAVEKQQVSGEYSYVFFVLRKP